MFQLYPILASEPELTSFQMLAKVREAVLLVGK
jgi:hypothetical protein